MGVKNQLMKGIMGSLLVTALVFTTFMGNFIPTEAAESNEVKKDNAVYVETTDMANYWSANDGEAKAPVKQGYVFAGWYTSTDAENFNALVEADIDSKNIPTDNTYAKFVSADILSVKTMVEGRIEKESSTIISNGEDDFTDFRFLSAVDSKNYQEVGFEYRLGGGATQTMAMTKIWSQLRKNPNGSDTITASQIFGTGAYAFIALDVTDVYEVNFDKIVCVRPYWVTMDGTKVMGMAKNVRVEDKYTDYSYVSAPVNLFTDGKSPAKIAGGKVTLTYNNTDYSVVKNSSGNMVDTGRMLPELECYVDENVGTITIVANSDKVNTNVLADGLFANIRFQHKTNPQNGNLADVDLQIKSSTEVGFCNWAEQDLTSKVNVQ